MENKPEMEDQHIGKFADGLMLPIFAVFAVFLFIVLCFYAYSNVFKKNPGGNEVVILQEDNSDFKQAPVDPGGMQVEHTDKEVFNTVTGNEEKISDEVKVEKQEQPISKEIISEAAEEPKTVIEIPSDENGSTEVTINTTESTNTVSEPEQNEIITNIPSETSNTVPSEENVNKTPEASEVAATLEQEAPAVAEEKADITSKQAVVDNDQPEAVSLSEDSEMLKTQQNQPIPQAAKVEEPVKQPTQTVVKAEIKKENNVKTGESKTVIQFKEPPLSMAKSMPKSMASNSSIPASVGGASAASGGFYVQVSSHATRSEAESAWGKIATKYPSEVAGHSKNIFEAEVGGKKYYRLSFGPFSDRGQASTKCGILKAKGQDCIIQKY